MFKCSSHCKHTNITNTPTLAVVTVVCIACATQKQTGSAVLFLLMLICSVLGWWFTARSAFSDTILPFVSVKVFLSTPVNIKSAMNCECTAAGAGDGGEPGVLRVLNQM